MQYWEIFSFFFSSLFSLLLGSCPLLLRGTPSRTWISSQICSTFTFNGTGMLIFICFLCVAVVVVVAMVVCDLNHFMIIEVSSIGLRFSGLT